jgi:hypothetical protein
MTMAAIYDYETAYTLSDGLQGCNVCDEAIRAAQWTADDRGEDVVLEDDDGVWLVHPADGDGTREPADELEADWA